MDKAVIKAGGNHHHSLAGKPTMPMPNEDTVETLGPWPHSLASNKQYAIAQAAGGAVSPDTHLLGTQLTQVTEKHLFCVSQ